MAGSLAQPVVLDATVLSNFASCGSIGWLADLLKRPVVASAVQDELERGRDAGYTFLSAAIDLIGEDLAVLTPADDGPDKRTIRGSLDSGEADSLLVALEQDGTLASDDLAARRLAHQYGVPVTGSVGLLVLGIQRAELSVTTADEWLETWRTERGYYAPVESIAEVVDEG